MRGLSRRLAALHTSLAPLRPYAFRPHSSRLRRADWWAGGGHSDEKLLPPFSRYLKRMGDKTVFVCAPFFPYIFFFSSPPEKGRAG